MHRRMQKNKHMQGNDLDTPTPNGLEMRYQGTIEYHRIGQAMQVDCGSYVPGR